MEKNAFEAAIPIFTLKQTLSWSQDGLWGEGGVPSDINVIENAYEILVRKPEGKISLTA